MKNALGEFQTIVVLGGRSDIGLAIAARSTSAFTKKVILAGRDMGAEDVDRFRQLLPNDAAALDVSVSAFDATEHSSHVAFFDGLDCDSLDLVIVAFGQLGDQEKFLRDPVSAADLVKVNMSGVVSSSLACASRLERQGSGHIVFLSSVAGLRARKSNFVYGATKAGMDTFALGLADALVPRGISVTVVRPGFVHSSMTQGLAPAPFATTIDNVAEAVVNGMRRGERIIWAPGVLKYVFAVLRILPAGVWRRLPIK